MATYKTKESIQAKGYVNEISIPYKGKNLQKTFDKGVLFNGIENNSFGETMIIFEENPSTNTIDRDTKILYDGKAQFAIDPTKVEKIHESVQYKTATQSEPISDLKYYTSANFLKSASVSVVPVVLIGAYCYHKKYSLLKSALLVSIPIVAITGLQYLGMGGGKNKYWGIFAPPSIRANQNFRIAEIEKSTGVPQKGYK